MVIATILGVVMLHSFYRAVASGKYERTVRAVAAIAILGGLMLSLLVIFPSPYISLTTNGVSEQTVDGYATGFEYDNNEARWTGLRSGTHRYEDAVGADVLNYDSPSNRNFTDRELTSYAGRPYYLALTEYDYQKEVVAYDGAVYSAEAFAAVEQEAGVSRVMSNGEFTLYYVDSERPPEPDDGSADDGNDAAGEQTGGEADAGGDESGGSEQTGTPEPQGTPIPEVTPDQTDEPNAPNDDGGDGESDDGGAGAGDGAATDNSTGDGDGTDAGGDAGTGDGDGAGTGDGTDDTTDAGDGTDDGGAGADDGGDAGTGGGTDDGSSAGGNQTGGGNTTGSLAFPVVGARSLV
jgi:hypothetical protein